MPKASSTLEAGEDLILSTFNSNQKHSEGINTSNSHRESSYEERSLDKIMNDNNGLNIDLSNHSSHGEDNSRNLVKNNIASGEVTEIHYAPVRIQ